LAKANGYVFINFYNGGLRVILAKANILILHDPLAKANGNYYLHFIAKVMVLKLTSFLIAVGFSQRI
jgi:hypothetical protein